MTSHQGQCGLVAVFAARMMFLLQAVVAGLATAACSDPGATFGFPPTDVVYEGDLIRIRAAPGLEPCGGTGRSMEAMLSLLISETELGDLESPIDVYWLNLEQVLDICTGGGSQVVGCSLSTTEAVTSRMPEEHEVVHAYFERKGAGTFRYSFFDEGMATVYGTETRAPAPQTPLEEAIMFDRRMPGVHNPRAGHFVSFLIDEFGPPTMAAFVAQSSSITPESLSADFEAHFGESLERVIDAYSETPESCTGAGWQRFSACELEPNEWRSPSTWEVDVGAACESELSLGAVGGSVRERFVYETVEDVVVGVGGVGGAESLPTVELMRCGGGCDDEFSYTHDLDEGGLLFGLPLDAGRYLMTTTFENDDEVEPGTIAISRG